MADFEAALLLKENATAFFKYCEFPNFMKLRRLYYCFPDEKCCEYGCCPLNSFGRYQTWKYCLFVVVLLFILLGGSWICQHPICTNPSRPETRTMSLHSYDAPYPRRSSHFPTCNSLTSCANTGFNRESRRTNMILDRICVSLRNRKPHQNLEHLINTQYIQCKIMYMDKLKPQVQPRFLLFLVNAPIFSCSLLQADPPSYNSVVKSSLADPPPCYNVIVKNIEEHAENGLNTNNANENSGMQINIENVPTGAENNDRNNNQNIINVEIHRCNNDEVVRLNTTQDSNN